MGKQSIDGDNSQTGAMLAGLLDWPQASCVFSLEEISITPSGKLPVRIFTVLIISKPR